MDDIDIKRAILAQSRARADKVEASLEEARAAKIVSAFENAERDEPLSVEDALDALK